MRLSVDTVAGTRGFAVAPIERFAVSSNDLMQPSGESRLHEKISLFEKGPTAHGRRQNASPEPIPEPNTDAVLQVLHLCWSRVRAMVVRIAIVVRSRDGVRFGPCPSIAKVPGEWKDRMHLASLALKGT